VGTPLSLSSAVDGQPPRKAAARRVRRYRRPSRISHGPTDAAAQREVFHPLQQGWLERRNSDTCLRGFSRVTATHAWAVLLSSLSQQQAADPWRGTPAWDKAAFRRCETPGKIPVQEAVQMSPIMRIYSRRGSSCPETHRAVVGSQFRLQNPSPDFKCPHNARESLVALRQPARPLVSWCQI
jgi:hypothetical protein